MDDELEIEALVAGLTALTLPNERFRHRDHLRFAHYRLLRDGYPLALRTVSEQIRRFAAHHGHGGKFNLTLTSCWVRLVAGALADEPRDCSFERLTARHPELMERTLPLRYYTRDRLFSDAARAAWLEPDLRDLPHCPVHPGVAA